MTIATLPADIIFFLLKASARSSVRDLISLANTSKRVYSIFGECRDTLRSFALDVACTVEGHSFASKALIPAFKNGPEPNHNRDGKMKHPELWVTDISELIKKGLFENKDFLVNLRDGHYLAAEKFHQRIFLLAKSCRLFYAKCAARNESMGNVTIPLPGGLPNLGPWVEACYNWATSKLEAYGIDDKVQDVGAISYFIDGLLYDLQYQMADADGIMHAKGMAHSSLYREAVEEDERWQAKTLEYERAQAKMLGDLRYHDEFFRNGGGLLNPMSDSILPTRIISDGSDNWDPHREDSSITIREEYAVHFQDSVLAMSEGWKALGLIMGVWRHPDRNSDALEWKDVWDMEPEVLEEEHEAQMALLEKLNPGELREMWNIAVNSVLARWYDKDFKEAIERVDEPRLSGTPQASSLVE